MCTWCGRFSLSSAMWEDSQSCKSSRNGVCYLSSMIKSSRGAQTWTLTSPICCSSSSLNNPLSVFLGEKSCNQILIPEAQTRWWELKSWRSPDLFSLLFLHPSSLSLPPSQSVSCFFIALVLFPCLSHRSLSGRPVLPPPSIWLLVVYNVRKPGKLTCNPEPRPVEKHRGYFLSCTQRGKGGGVEMGRREMREKRREIDGSFGKEGALPHTKLFQEHVGTSNFYCVVYASLKEALNMP